MLRKAERLILVFRTKPHVPNTIIQTARNPLPDQIPRFLGLYKGLIAVDVCDVPESLPFDLMKDSTSAGGGRLRCYTHSSICDETCVD
jgi:hypothetical protein